jgi:ABC-type nitrate/sulfonate/bicarbonate transport system ATPase subunit
MIRHHTDDRQTAIRFETRMHLKCRHIDFCYPGTDKRVLENVSLELTEPGFHSFFGPSGVGKTSLAHILSGQLTAFGGEVATEGLNKVLYAYNLERLPGWSAIGRHLERVTPVHKQDVKNSLMEVFGLKPLLSQRFSQLSLGQQNRINLVRYLVQEFDLLIMDESLANVDEMTRGRILMAIKEMFPQAMFIYISHNVVEVAKFCRQIWVLRDAHKAPQAVMVQGLDLSCDRQPDQKILQHAMLEIMNAA